MNSAKKNFKNKKKSITNAKIREVVRGVSGVSWDTPIFQDLLYKFQQKMFQKVYALT